jgi:L-phenylalanine/L-methionine N-acetyltransferase
MTQTTLHVRRASPDDAADFARLMGDPDVFGNLMQLPLPSAEHWKQRLASPPGPDHLHVVAVRSGQLVGSAGLHPNERLRRRHSAMLGISVAVAAQGQGVGTELMRTLCDYADNWAQILRIELTVFTDNARAIALYQRFGFRVEGTHRAYALRRGRFDDVLAMARLHPHPPAVAWDTPSP